MTSDLFAGEHPQERFAPGAWLLRGFALPSDEALYHGVQTVTAAAPPRVMHTPGGQVMSVAITNCGALGWVSDRRGYRYEPCDPTTGQPWPAMPAAFHDLAVAAAQAAGYAAFEPDACLVNHYAPGARMGLHQDRDECDVSQPIVSVSLGLPATFLFGGATRSERTARLPLTHGDVVVWGGPARLFFHGVQAVAAGTHPLFGAQRINLTFRKAG